MNNEKIKNQIQTQEAIIRTIAFFDMFDYPLTAWEAWKYCDIPSPRLDAIEPPLSRAGRTGSGEGTGVRAEGGFYFLPGREKIVETRKKRYNYSLRKLKRARLIAKVFKIIPWIKMIAVGNIIGSYNLKDESDIDLFIITEKNRIWLSRFGCVLITKILNLRPTPKNSRDKICLSFFVSEEKLNLKDLMLDEKDPYFVYWLAGLYPIYNANNTWTKFYEANSWLKNYLPNWQVGKFNNQFNAGKPWPKFYRLVIGLIFGWTEKLIKIFQLKVLAPELKSLMNKDTRVVINDQILKLHVLDRREHYRDLYYNKLNEILKQNN